MSTYTVLRRIGWRRLPDAWIGDQFMYHVPKDYYETASYSGKPNYPVPAIRYGYAIGYYGRTERNLVEAQYNDPHKDHWFMFELETQRIVGSSCPCCQG